MKHRATGVVFLFISALFNTTRFISTSILASSIGNTNEDLFQHYLNYSNSLLYWSRASLILGLIYLLYAEYKTFLKSKSTKED